MVSVRAFVHHRLTALAPRARPGARGIARRGIRESCNNAAITSPARARVAGDDGTMATPRLDPPVEPNGLLPVDQLIERQESLVPEFERLIRGKSAEVLTQPDHDGGWAIIDIVSHIHDWERVTHDRVHRILADETPELPEFDDSLWSIEHHYRDNDIAIVVAELRELRDALVAELRALPAEAWHRRAVLEGTGPITLHWLIDRITAHDARHLAQARDILS
jgi:hypothetical protein